jgi:cytochrome oxidase Cu insertion factor (SCO1/SenC/PrrC family)
MKMPVIAIAVLGGIVLAASALAAAPDFAGMQIQHYDPPKPAPTFALPNLEGATVRLEDLKGKMIMLVFWATW